MLLLMHVLAATVSWFVSRWHEHLETSPVCVHCMAEKSTTTQLTQAKPERVVFDFNATAAVATPLFSYSARSLLFKYFYQPDHEQSAHHQTLTVRNESKLALAAVLKAPPPFALSTGRLDLQPGAQTELGITMHHDFRHDLVSLQLKCGSAHCMLHNAIDSSHVDPAVQIFVLR